MRNSVTLAKMEPFVVKLRPSRFPGMSPFMAAVVGYVLGESFTDPEIAEIKVSEAENLVYIRQAGAVGFDGIQSLDDLRNNWNRLRRGRWSRRRACRRMISYRACSPLRTCWVQVGSPPTRRT